MSIDEKIVPELADRFNESFHSLSSRFQFLRCLGHGGMGIVYAAHDREQRINVAIKQMGRAGPEFLTRFKQEFRALSDVVHPNLVSLYEFISDGDEWFITMELIDGAKDFVSYVRGSYSQAHFASTDHTVSVDTAPLHDDDKGSPASASAPLAPPTRRIALPETANLETAAHSTTGDRTAARSIPTAIHSHDGTWQRATPAPLDQAGYRRLRAALPQLILGVQALHRAEILHRDLKPSNVLVDTQGRVVAADFGLVAELKPAAGHRNENAPQHATDDGDLVGTVSHMSPEQVMGHRLTEASDWYAVGVILYEALTGVLPLMGSKVEILTQKQTIDPPPPAELIPGVPIDLNSLCRELLHRDPDRRLSGSQIISRLDRASAAAPAANAASGNPGWTLPFVGRNDLLDDLHSSFNAMCVGTAIVVHVSGRSGVGKSRLVQQFLDQLAGKPGTVVLQGRCYENESVPYKAIDSLLDSLSQYLRSRTAEEIQSLVPRDMGLLARVFPVLSQVSAVLDSPQILPVPDRRELRRRAFAALRELLARLGDRHPLVLCIDDLHWGDVDSAEILQELTRTPRPPRLMLLVSYRSENLAQNPCLRVLQSDVGNRSAQRYMKVKPLAPEDARDLARQLLVHQPADVDSVIQWVAEESRGMPYFILELIQHLSVGIHVDQNADQGEGIDLDGVLWRRVERLPEPSRSLLEILAVAGQPLPAGQALAAADLEADRHTLIALLKSEQLVHTFGPRLTDEIGIFHDRIRESVIAHVSLAVRRKHHEKLALALEQAGADAERVADHYQGAGKLRKAGEHYYQAAEQASESLAFDRAARLYRLALDRLPAEPPQQAALQIKLGDALANAGRGVEAATHYQAAAERLPDQGAQLERLAAYQYCISGHVAEGRAAFQRVLSRYGMSLASSPSRALLSLLRRRLQLWLRGLEFQQSSAEHADPQQLERIDVVWSVAAGLSMFDVVEAADFQARNVLLSLSAGEPVRLARSLAWEAAHLSNLGGSTQRRVEKLLDAAERLAGDTDSPYATGVIAMSSGAAAWTNGRWHAALNQLQQADKILRGQCTNVAWELGTTNTFLVWSLMYLGELNQLCRRVETLMNEARQRGDLYAETTHGAFSVPMSHLVHDRPLEASESIRHSLAQWSHRGFHVQHSIALMAGAYIDFYQGHGLESHRRYQQQWRHLRRSHLLRIQALKIFNLHLRARAALMAAAERRSARALLRAAARDARRIAGENMPYGAPHAEHLFAGVAAAKGDLDGALRHLTVAQSGYEAADMKLFAVAMQRRRGELVGGQQGGLLIAQADRGMRGEGVENPARFCDAFAVAVD